RKKLKELGREELCGFIFKSRSPSSGIRGVKVYTSSGMPGRSGAGLFGGAFVKHFPMIPAEDDGRLHDPLLRENFIERVFVLKRWRDFLKKGSSMRNIISFHTKHKLLIIAHSPKHYTTPGRLVAKSRARKRLHEEYITILMEGFKLLATVKKNTNVLMHCIGYFKKKISADEKQELLEVINNYHKGLIPLVVPITLINHYVRKYNEPYLKDQYYLNPHPIELMLRNHV
ncbi:MAG: YbgA family protein, partial [Candidatus Hodarchaeales archaeon]